MYRSNRYMYIINALLVIAIILNIIFIGNIDTDSYNIKTNSKQLNTYLVSEKIEKEEEKTEEKIAEKTQTEPKQANKEKPNEKKQEQVKTENKKTTQIKKETKKQENKKETKTETKSSSKKEETKKEIVQEKESVKQEKVLEKLTGALAGYGPDCYGCTSFRTASGRYIGDGKIYYDDKEYGTIRIVAGDKKYPFGTIVKITNTKYDDNSPIYAIVLDRGGGVGIGKKFLFDLLFKTEKEASKYGSRKNVTFEILRLGY